MLCDKVPFYCFINLYMSDCVFCKIVAGEISSVKIWEDDYVFVFLDVHPLRKGHCLIIPKLHYQDIFDIDKKTLQYIILTAKNMADIFKNKLGATWVNIINASGKDAEQSVFHFHLHLVPRYPDDWLKINDRRETKLQKIAIEELQKIAQQIQK